MFLSAKIQAQERWKGHRQISERKLFKESSEEHDYKEICDNEASEDKKCGFSSGEHLMDNVNNLMTRFNAKERADSDTTKNVLGLEAGNSSCVKDANFNVLLVAHQFQKQTFLFLTYAYSK
jgi:hypothetical protein